MLFQTWNRDQIVEFIQTCEMAIATGNSSVTSPDGSVTHRSLRELAQIIRKLYQRLGQVDGKNYGTGTHPRSAKAVFDNGYGGARRLGSRRGPFNV